jgi:hypothetical protein
LSELALSSCDTGTATVSASCEQPNGIYVSQLKERIRVASRTVEPNVRQALEQALGYIRKITRPSR